MITIEFTQCDPDFQMDDFSQEMCLWPIIPRLEKYKTILTECAKNHPNASFSTLDEHFILVAQWLKGKGVIKDLQVISHCHHGSPPITITIDEEGDFTDDCHHRFFTQRLKYLR